jgi:ribosomal protein S18 acetylase RimI-like enzyme
MSEVTMKTQQLDNQPVLIEQAVAADTEAICELLRQTWLDTYPNDQAGITRKDILLRLEGERGERIPQGLERWRNNINSTDGSVTVYVARTGVGGKVVGFTAPSIVDGQRRLDALYVLPETQGIGVGGKLIRKALEWLGTDQDIYLAVASYNQNAINFYKKFGFEPTNRPIEDEGDVYAGKQIPEIEMVLQTKTSELGQ